MMNKKINKTKRKIAILALMAVFVFSWGAVYSPVRADSGVSVGAPGDPDDGSGSKGSGGKGTKPPPSPPPTTTPSGGKDWIEILMDLLWYI